MDARALKEFLEAVRAGKVSVDEAVRRIADLPVQHVADFAQLDGERALRQGVPEVVFGERKTPEQISALVAKLVSLGQAVLVTRMPPEAEKAVLTAAPDGRYDPVSRTFTALPSARLNSCAANVSVVNIDNGFSAGFTAALIARQSHRARK